MGSDSYSRIHFSTGVSAGGRISPTLKTAIPGQKGHDTDTMMNLGETIVFEPSPSAVHKFMRDLVAAHSDDSSSFDIVVDNAKSGETARKWNAIRRTSMRRCSMPTPTRWSSDSGLSLAVRTSPEDTHRTFHEDSCLKSNRVCSERRNSLDPSMMNRSISRRHVVSRPTNKSTATDANAMEIWKGDSSTATFSTSTTVTNLSNKAERRESLTSMSSLPEDTPPTSPVRQTRGYTSTGTSCGSESDFSDYFTSDVDELEQKLQRAAKPVPKGAPAESALSFALISTIERLSVRAALAMCRPQTSCFAQLETMQTIDEAMELLPTRGSVTDISTSRCRRSMDYFSGEDDTTDTDIQVGTQTYDFAATFEAPEYTASKQHSDLNHAMLAAIDRLSVRAALTLTSHSSDYANDEKSGDES